MQNNRIELLKAANVGLLDDIGSLKSVNAGGLKSVNVGLLDDI